MIPVVLLHYPSEPLLTFWVALDVSGLQLCA